MSTAEKCTLHLSFHSPPLPNYRWHCRVSLLDVLATYVCVEESTAVARPFGAARGVDFPHKFLGSRPSPPSPAPSACPGIVPWMYVLSVCRMEHRLPSHPWLGFPLPQRLRPSLQVGVAASSLNPTPPLIPQLPPPLASTELLAASCIWCFSILLAHSVY